MYGDINVHTIHWQLNDNTHSIILLHANQLLPSAFRGSSKILGASSSKIDKSFGSSFFGFFFAFVVLEPSSSAATGSVQEEGYYVTLKTPTILLPLITIQI